MPLSELDRDKIREAEELLNRGGSVYVSRYIAGELRARYRRHTGETRRVYVVRDGYHDWETVHIELREKGDY